MDEFKRRRARRGDLIVEKSGGGERQPVGRVVLHDADEDVMPTNFAGRLRPAQGVDSRFLCYLLASLYTDGRTISAVKQTTGIQNLDLGALLESQVRIPSEEEQRGIANYLDVETARIDALIAKKQRLRCFMREWIGAFTGEWLRGLAAAHGEVVLRRWVMHVEQGWSPICDDHPAQANEWGVLKTSAVSSGQFNSAENKRLPDNVEPQLRWAVRDGDLLMTRGSGSASSVGQAAVARTAGRKLTISDLIYRVRLSEADPDFVAAVLRSPQVRRQIEGAIRTDAGQTLKLRGEDVLGLTIPAVPGHEQRRSLEGLSNRITPSHDVDVALSRQIALLQERRQALITAAVTGELDLAEVG